MEQEPGTGTPPRRAGTDRPGHPEGPAAGGLRLVPRVATLDVPRREASAETALVPPRRSGAGTSPSTPHRPDAEPSPVTPRRSRAVPEEATVRRHRGTGRTELAGVDGPEATAALAPLGLRRTPDGRWIGVVGEGDFRLVLAAFSELVDEAARRRHPFPVRAVGARRSPGAGRVVSPLADAGPADGGDGGEDGDEDPPAPPASDPGEPGFARAPRGAAPRCAICGREPTRVVGGFDTAALPDLICPACDARATERSGTPLAHDPVTGAPPNPVYVDGRRCWRLYRLGGWVTVVDRNDAPTLDDFLAHCPGPTRRPR